MGNSAVPLVKRSIVHIVYIATAGPKRMNFMNQCGYSLKKRCAMGILFF
jgi:hypothetical protein